MNKISDLHEKFTSDKERKKEEYVREAFEVSGKGFEFTFSDQIVDLVNILNHCRSNFYPTWQEASEAAVKLGIKSSTEYRARYKEDPRLPGELRLYKDFPGTIKFLQRFYPTWQEASDVAARLGLESIKDYKKRCKICDPKLPYEPEKHYKDFPSFVVFFGKKFNPYPTWQEASRAVRKLKIKSMKEYPKKYKKDSRLPCNPDTFYRDYPGFKKFLGKDK
jgi:hypothetical protein